jgi:hypothetical protein
MHANAAGTKLFEILGIFLPGVIQLFGLFFSIEVIQVAKPFIKPMHGLEEIHFGLPGGFCQTELLNSPRFSILRQEWDLFFEYPG